VSDFLKTIKRNGKTMTINDTDWEIGDVWEDKGKIYTLKYYSWPGYDKCPVCQSEETFHKARIKEDPKLSNIFPLTIISDSNEQIYVKRDVCLKCGNIWAGQIFIWAVQ